jgi:hypothetical protein
MDREMQNTILRQPANIAERFELRFARIIAGMDVALDRRTP